MRPEAFAGWRTTAPIAPWRARGPRDWRRRFELGEPTADADAGLCRERRAIVEHRPSDIAGLVCELAEAPFTLRAREPGL